MEKKGGGFVSKVHRKNPDLKPMSRHIQRSNAGKSVIRSRVEHVFAFSKRKVRRCGCEGLLPVHGLPAYSEFAERENFRFGPVGPERQQAQPGGSGSESR